MQRQRACLLLLLCVLLSSACLASLTKPSLTNKLVELITKKEFNAFTKELSKDDMDTNQPDAKGRLPLMEAVKAHEIKFVDALIQFGATASSKDPATGTSPLQVAFQTSQVEVARLLLAYGADVNAVDKAGKKPRDFTPNQEISDLVTQYDSKGAMAFEDAPGTWIRTEDDKGHKYWFNLKTKAARWNVPPSCAWQRVQLHGMPSKYVNFVTGQTVTKLPPALSWRLVRQGGSDLWYNWASNHTQHEQPDELPTDMLGEAKEMKNVRWYNSKTGEHTWEDPRFSTSWREIQDDESGKPFFYNVHTGESTWDVPEEMAWTQVPSEEHGRQYWFNTKTGESSWEQPDHKSWHRQDSDL